MVWWRTLECNIKIVQVTIDGPREVNDRRRPHKNGGPVYDIIVKNLKDNAHFFERISVRINVDKTNERFISDLLEELKSMPNNIHPYLAPLHTDNVSNVTFSGICYDSKDFGLEVENRPELVGLLKYPQPNYGVCGATKENSFCVDPEGYLYKCWNEVGQKEKSIGSVESHITNYERYLKWITFDPSNYSECGECPILPICNAFGCPYRILFPEETGHAKECLSDKFNLEKNNYNYKIL